MTGPNDDGARDFADVRVVHPGRAVGGSRAGGPCRGRAGDASWVRAGVVARPAGARGSPVFPALFTGAAGGPLAAHLPGLSETPAVAVLMAVIEVRRVTVMSRRAELGLDPESRGWMDGLHSPAAKGGAVLARLQDLLLHVPRHEAGRRNGSSTRHAISFASVLEAADQTAMVRGARGGG